LKDYYCVLSLELPVTAFLGHPPPGLRWGQRRLDQGGGTYGAWESPWSFSNEW